MARDQTKPVRGRLIVTSATVHGMKQVL